MGLKSKICYGLAVIGTLGLIAGTASAVATGVLADKHEEKALAMLKSDETYRITMEFDGAKTLFEAKTEKFLSGEMDPNEYIISKMDFTEAERQFNEDLKELDSRKHLQDLIKTAPLSEECSEEYEKSKKLTLGLVGSMTGALFGFAATCPEMIYQSVPRTRVIIYRER